MEINEKMYKKWHQSEAKKIMQIEVLSLNKFEFQGVPNSL